MPFSLSDLLYGGVLPAVTAALVAWCVHRWGKADAARPWLTIVPFIAGFQSGYWFLQLGPVIPESHWQWLPWVLLLSLSAGLPPRSQRAAMTQHFILTSVTSVAAAWVLVPDWEQLEPSRFVYQLLLAVAVVLVTLALEPLSARIAAVPLLIVLAAVLTCGAVILALAGSLRFAQTAGCGVAALAGLAIALRIPNRRESAVGIALPVTLLLAALMLIGRVNSFSDVPLVSYLLPPLAPLSLWLAVKGPLAKARGWRRWLVLSIPVLIGGIAVVFAAAAELAGNADR